MKEFRVFQQIQDTPSKNEKIQILKSNDSESLRKLLFLTYNRFQTYRVKKIDMPAKFNTVQPDITLELDKLLTLLAQHETGSNEAKRLIQNLLARCNENGANWVSKIITRDLKIGIDEGTVNRAFPDLVPVFEIQLCEPIYKGGKTPKNRWETVQYPIIIEEKLDGCRAICIVRDGKVTFFSREGHSFDHKGAFEKEILSLRPGTDYCLDGEIISFKFNPDNAAAVKSKDHGWNYEGGKSMWVSSSTTKAELEEYVGYFCWDILELDVFESQGKKGKVLGLTDRKLQLCSLFERNEKEFKNVFLVPNVIAHSEKEVRGLFRQIRDKEIKKYSAVNIEGQTIEFSSCRAEGLMLKVPDAPYAFRRASNILKIKEFPTADLRIVGAYEGKPGTKFEGMLGGIELKDDTGIYSTDCGSGFDYDERYELWQRHLRGELVGAIWQISFQEITADNSLRFPVAQFERTDKTTTNVE